MGVLMKLFIDSASLLTFYAFVIMSSFLQNSPLDNSEHFLPVSDFQFLDCKILDKFIFANHVVGRGCTRDF